MIVTIEDIERRIGEEIPDDERDRVEDLIGDATSTVEGHIGQRVAPPAPDAIERVICRMVTRALGVSDGENPVGMSGEMFVAGSFTRQRQFTAGSQDGGVWLSSQDKIMLRPYRKRRGIVSVAYGGLG
ncbi:hypothetical protein [Corynebacterium glyciniphilum]|uniref:hypothetical protein n=1 Tax=Corynebacterium glyciniphilum TaxID=1404244 RepID=UPI003FD12C28